VANGDNRDALWRDRRLTLAILGVMIRMALGVAERLLHSKGALNT
jgi:hypothetical protein